jgi:hypothetical protein
MEQGYSKQFKTMCVVIENGENPPIEKLIEFAHQNNATLTNEAGDTDIVVDDQSGRYEPVGPELYELHDFEEKMRRGQTLFYELFG